MTKFFMGVFGILSAVFVLFSSAPAQVIVDRILVQVDDRIITKVAFEEAFAPIRAHIEGADYGVSEKESLLARYREELLGQMIDQAITDIAVEEAGILISDQEVDQTMAQFRQSHGLSEEEFEKALMAEGLTLELYRKQTREQMLRARLVNYKVRSRIVITREDVENFYKNNPERFGAGKRYHLAHILLPFSREMTAEGEGNLKKKAEEILEKLQAGADFGEMAQKESASTIAGPGGELGWFDPAALSPVIREAIGNLPMGGVSKPVRTPQGFQLFRVLAVDAQPAQPLEEVADAIADELYEEEVNRRFRQWITELREKVHVRILD
jgi:peptidyl-prolyl cis-trans isomerase SurA